MNVIVPLGGLGTRFQNEGYNRPKPFVRVLGKEMILWVLDSLNLGPGTPPWRAHDPRPSRSSQPSRR